MVARQIDRRSVEIVERDRGRVLLIADQHLDLLNTTLAGAGFEIVEVSRSPAALVSLQRSRPHIVVAAIAMKGMTMTELGRMLNQVQEGIPLLLVGVETSTIARRLEALQSGAADYFQIPTELSLLAERARQLLEQRQLVDRLRADADLDYLTGLSNRRRFRKALGREVERWRRYGVPCALLMLDIDHLKVINDQHGHPVGDVVIRHIANTLLAVSRENDTPARLGGEEFALLLAGISGEKAALAAERLLLGIADRPVEGVGQVTVSIGVAACPLHANSERTLYAAGDRALYVAKNEGRNRVAVAALVQENLPGVS
jgi:diguanylate cyclase (GGDEF)-like protein